jgi:hypothetical protein
MTQFFDTEEANKLRLLAKQNTKATELCLEIMQLFPSRANEKFFLLQAIMIATGHGLQRISPIMGWQKLGGELSDEKIEKLIGPL